MTHEKRLADEQAAKDWAANNTSNNVYKTALDAFIAGVEHGRAPSQPASRRAWTSPRAGSAACRSSKVFISNLLDDLRLLTKEKK